MLICDYIGSICTYKAIVWLLKTVWRFLGGDNMSNMLQFCYRHLMYFRYAYTYIELLTLLG